MKQLTRSDILRASLRRKRVDVPEWGGYVYVRELTVAEVDSLGRELQRGDLPPDLRARLIRMATVDEQGNPIFQRGDEERIAQGGAAPLLRLSNEILAVSGLIDGVDAEKKGS